MPYDIEQLIADAKSGTGARQVRAAARLISLLEAEPQRLPELFRYVDSAGEARPGITVGVTGAPGSGKSTATDALIHEYRSRYPDRRVGVIAVDPTSPFTGGAVLGDRVRMMRHATDPMVFIRSMASRGHLGGLSLGVRGALRVLGLIGCKIVFVETVGVGQSEVEVAAVADEVVIILAPGHGDGVQMLKAGLIEIGDVFVVNKSDLDGAEQLHSVLLRALSLSRETGTTPRTPVHQLCYEYGDDSGSAEALEPEVFLTSAVENRGIPELLEALVRRGNIRRVRRQERRDAAVIMEVREAVMEEVRRRIESSLGGNSKAKDDLERIASGEASVEELVTQLMKKAVRDAGKDTDKES